MPNAVPFARTERRCHLSGFVIFLPAILFPRGSYLENITGCHPPQNIGYTMKCGDIYISIMERNKGKEAGMKLSFRQVCMFWGVMDVLYLSSYVWQSITAGRIPLIDDIFSFNQLFTEQGGGYWLILIFTLSIITTLSIVLSAVLLLTAWQKVGYLVAAQTPLRLLLVVPSLSFLPWFLKGINSGGIGLALVLLLTSEALKVWSVIFSKKRTR